MLVAGLRASHINAAVTIYILTDDVLLEIFDWYMKTSDLDACHALVHVSRNWRSIVFNSRRRLNLRLLFSARTPVREMLVLWPPLPIAIRCFFSPDENEDNIVAALEHYDRVCEIYIGDIPSSLLERLLAAMQQPFPALESLFLASRDNMAPVLPGSFLGGSAPHLRSLRLTGIPFPFPGLRKLLSSATDLVALTLYTIPHSGYFSPEAMVTCLSVLKRLESVQMRFQSPLSRPYRQNRRLPPRTRTLLPALRSLIFTGVSEYLEDLVARIDAPLLNQLDMTFFHQLIFDTLQLAQFISRNFYIQEGEADNEAHVIFSESLVSLRLSWPFADSLRLETLSSQTDWQLSALAQFCCSSFPRDFILTVEHLYITEIRYWQLHWKNDMDNSQWLELLHPFIGVKNLFLSTEFAPRIAPALQELVGESANEVLPALQSIRLEEFHSSGVVPNGIAHFLNVRNLSGHPVTVVHWER